MLEGKKTPESVKAALGKLRGRITNAQIAAYCAKAGRKPKTAERLAEIIKAL
jgi:hypothetical protein